MSQLLAGRRAKIGLTIVCFVFGIAVVGQIRAESRIRSTVGTDSATDLAAIAGDLYDNNSALRAEVDKLTTERSAGTSALDVPSQSEQVAELARLRAFNGVDRVSGAGVKLSVDADLRPTDLLDLVNEFRNAGAEAIAVGGHRVVYKSAIGGAQGNLTLNGAPLIAPFVVTSIGDAEVRDRALARKGGMLAYLRTSYPRAKFDLETADRLTLPAYPIPFEIQLGS